MRISVPNNTKSPIYVGSTMILPGESKDFEENDVPMHLRPQTPAPVVLIAEGPMTTEQITGLLAESTATIVLAFPALTPDHIQQLGQAERDGKAARADLMQALEAEYKKRQAPAEEASKAAAAAEADKKLAELSAKPAKDVIAALQGLSNEELGKLEALEKARGTDDKKGTEPRKSVLEAISALTLERAGGGSGSATG